MPHDQRNITFFALLSCAVIFVLTGCVDSGDPLGVGPDEATINPNQVVDECPTWEEASEEIAWAVYWACPPDGDWKSKGQLNACRKKAVKENLKNIKDCFSEGEYEALLEYVLSWTPGIDSAPNGDPKAKIRME